MKHLLAALPLAALSLGTPASAQQSPVNKFEMTFSCGTSYNLSWNDWSDNSGPVMQRLPKMYLYYSAGFDIKLKENRYIGLEVAHQETSNRISDIHLFSSVNSGILTDNYRNSHVWNYYGIHFRTEFSNNLHLTTGFFFYSEHFTWIDVKYFDPYLLVIIENPHRRTDDFGLTAALGYSYPIKDYFRLGIRGRTFLTFVGFENITITPYLSFSF